MEKLLSFLIKWAKNNDFEIIVSTDDKEIDFVNINLKTKKIYFDELDIKDDLTEVG